ncbi:ImmA/IrrE family metallo-endopeptidase [Enterococcus innesii]|uniref:ImmA/IrrE family metallo-endopeptidase n=1 Tax=Enterococcus innesii TaxID=2839759 RepID=UPI002090A5D1|nr:ImmA/IrrE family metallo-endopeptidase [Enterococcus innesii]MCO5495882.1 ImmA/IrrE family metallo-endopeptidase [Enterococcus innesii]
MNRSGIYYAKEKAIFLSDKLLESNSDFEISHELGHCIKKHEELSAYYNATDYSRRKLEFEANRIAIEILLFIWSNEYDLERATECSKVHGILQHTMESRKLRSRKHAKLWMKKYPYRSYSFDKGNSFLRDYKIIISKK